MTVTAEELSAKTEAGSPGLTIRPMTKADVDGADHVMRVAFGTYLNAPDPVQVFGDSDHVHTRYAAAPEWAVVAELDGEVVGSNFATRWGSFGFFGPLTVRPDLWDRGIASRLLEPVVDLFGRWQVTLAGLFTFPESPKHVGLYQKYGFWPQRLTPLMAKAVDGDARARARAYSSFSDPERAAALDQCRSITDAIYAGLDLEHEIVATSKGELGEVLLLEDGDRGVTAFAICHCGPATEAGSDTCFVKFAAAAPGDGVEARFQRLVDACEGLAAERGLSRLVAGVNTARQGAYRTLLGSGFTAFLNGLTMMRPDEPGYNRPDAFVIDDLR